MTWKFMKGNEKEMDRNESWSGENNRNKSGKIRTLKALDHFSLLTSCIISFGRELTLFTIPAYMATVYITSTSAHHHHNHHP